MKKKKINYMPNIMTFDIETSSWLTRNGKQITIKQFEELTKKQQHDEVEHHAMMYVWMINLDGKHYSGRTWKEFRDFMKNLTEKFSLNVDNRLVVYIHNLSFETEFIRTFFKWDSEKCLCIDKRTPATLVCEEGFEFRCSYLLSNSSLENIKLFNSDVKKMAGDLDYNLIRHSETPLTEKEWGYCWGDVDKLYEYVKQELKTYGSFENIPSTATGKVRKDIKKQLGSNLNYLNKISKLTMHWDEYVMCRKAYAGGFTHGSFNHIGRWTDDIDCASSDICKDVKHIDFTSSYPAVMVLFAEYPASKGKHLDLSKETSKSIKRHLEQDCCIFTAKLKNVRIKKDVGDFIISLSKCEEIDFGDKTERECVFNGRVQCCESLITTITNIDLDSFEMFYDFKIEILDMWVYRKDYLPKEFINIVLQYYEGKTTLKGVEGKEEEYQRSKEFVNCLYGLVSTDPIRDEVKFDGNYIKTYNTNKMRTDAENYLLELKDEFDGIETTDKNTMYHYNKGKRFISYTWAPFITALARYNLFTGIATLGTNYIYSDTDSIFYYNNEEAEEYINSYNEHIMELIEISSKYNEIPIEKFKPKTIKGIEKPIGVWDFEEDIEWFRTLGAKRYVEYRNGKAYLTCAGVNKKKGSEYLNTFKGFTKVDEYEIPNSVIKFDEHLIFPSENSGRLISYIVENDEGDVVDYLGNKAHYKEASGLSLCPSKYDMSKVSRILDGIENMIIYN